MLWARDFYDKQDAWSGCYTGPVEDRHRARAAQLGPPGRVLELGCGGGQCARAALDLGHTVVAVELGASAAHARTPGVDVRQADFYEVEIEGVFDRVCYWDGFGIGSDADQRRLLRRIADWLAPEGRALIEIYNPAFAASTDGQRMTVGSAEREYAWDPPRWLDTWWPRGHRDEAVTQSLRCYTETDLRSLCNGVLGMESFAPLETPVWSLATLRSA
jgi:SAM-dependent methyltransferase